MLSVETRGLAPTTEVVLPLAAICVKLGSVPCVAIPWAERQFAFTGYVVTSKELCQDHNVTQVCLPSYRMIQIFVAQKVTVTECIVLYV